MDAKAETRLNITCNSDCGEWCPRTLSCRCCDDLAISPGKTTEHKKNAPQGKETANSTRQEIDEKIQQISSNNFEESSCIIL